MKILFCPAHYVYDEHLWGSESYTTFTICDRIAKQYPRSIVVTGKKRILKEKNYKVIEIQKNKTRLDMSFLNALIFSVLYTFTSIRLLFWDKENFDIIHHVRPFSLGTSFNIIPFLRLKNTKFIIGSFSSPYKKHYEAVDVKENLFLLKLTSFVYLCIKPFLKKLSIQTIKLADKVIVYDKYTSSLVSRYIPKSKISIIPPGKDKNIYRFDGKKNWQKANFSLVAVSYLSYRKGVDIIIKAFAELLKKTDREITLQIIGDGVERKNLEKLVKILEVEEKVRFIGSVENRFIQNYYEKVDIFIHAAREESYAQVYIEALASGLPIVSSKNMASSQILEPNNLAIFFSQEDHLTLAKKIIELIEKPHEMKKLSLKGREYFEKNYDWNTVIIPKYLEVYRSLIN